jgi:hypothetical protein
MAAVLDTQSECVLQAEAEEINFIGQDLSPETIIRKIQPCDTLCEPLRVVQLDDDRVATLYRIPEDENVEFDVTRSQPGNTETSTNDEGRAIYAAEWGSQRGTAQRNPRYQFQTLLFDGDPTVKGIRTAFQIADFKYRVEFGDIDLAYICKKCESQVHWTEVPTSISKPREVAFGSRIELIENRECGCQNSVDPVTAVEQTQSASDESTSHL